MIEGPRGLEFNFKDKNAQDGYYIRDMNGKERQLLLVENTNQIADHAEATSTSVWDCSLLLSKYLENNANEWVFGKSILELGSGLGLTGLGAAFLGAKKVYLSDTEAAIPTLNASIQLNGISSICKAGVIDWFHPPPIKSLGLGDHIDLILCADIVWVLDLIEPLVSTIDKYSTSHTSVLIAHQTRSLAADELFFCSLKERGFSVQEIPFSDTIVQRETIKLYLARKSQ